MWKNCFLLPALLICFSLSQNGFFLPSMQVFALRKGTPLRPEQHKAVADRGIMKLLI